MSNVPIKSYISAAYPLLAVETVEESRLLFHLINEFTGKDGTSSRITKTVSASGDLQTWTLSTDKKRLVMTNKVAHDSKGNPFIKAFENAIATDRQTLVVYDLQHFIKNAAIYRSLKDLSDQLKRKQSIIILVAPSWSMPPELEYEVPIINWSLPTRTELKDVLNAMKSNMESLSKKSIKITSDMESKLLDNMTGLTINQAQDVLSLSHVHTKQFDPAIVEEQKIALIRNSGKLEYWKPTSLNTIGGLDVLKDYVTYEVLPSKDDPELMVRGILMTGPPGTGKSLAAKGISGMLGWPLLRMDIGKLKGSLVGQSEANIAEALKLADATSPCVLWIDEIEKGVGGYASSAYTDSGVTLGMVGQLLTWMQEHTTPAFVLATCNDLHKLPPELRRAGRFDQTFFVDLPNLKERMEIAAIHLSTFTHNIDHAPFVASITKEWTGAEIRELVRSAARRSNRKPTEELLLECQKNIKPLSVSDPERIKKMRDEAVRTLQFANTPDVVEEEPEYSRLVTV